MEDTATAWFNMLEPNVSLAEFTNVTKAAFNDEVEDNQAGLKPTGCDWKTRFCSSKQGMILGIATAGAKTQPSTR